LSATFWPEWVGQVSRGVDLGVGCWRVFRSAASLIRHNQAGPSWSITSLGRFSLPARQWNITPYEAQKELFVSSETHLVVLPDIDAPYLNALLPQLVAAPVDGNHYYSFSRLWHYGKPEAAQLVQIASPARFPSTPSIASKDVDQDIKRLPLIQGYS
jgi:hypothetical protein